MAIFNTDLLHGTVHQPGKYQTDTWHSARVHDDVIKGKHTPRYWSFVRGDSPVTGEFSAQRPVTRSFDFFFHLRMNKQLSKYPLGWWFGTPSHPWWRRCSVERWVNTTGLAQAYHRAFQTSVECTKWLGMAISNSNPPHVIAHQPSNSGRYPDSWNN